MYGVRSSFVPGSSDRAFAFRCVGMESAVTSDCSWTTANDYGAVLEVDTSTSTVITGSFSLALAMRANVLGR